MTTGQYRTVRDIADMLKVGESTIRRWIRDGETRAIAIERGWRIANEDLNDFLKQHANPPHRAGEKAIGVLNRQTPGSLSESGCSTPNEGEAG